MSFVNSFEKLSLIVMGCVSFAAFTISKKQKKWHKYHQMFYKTACNFRLPLFQGAAPDYVIPLLAMAAISKERCVIDDATSNTSFVYTVTD